MTRSPFQIPSCSGWREAALRSERSEPSVLLAQIPSGCWWTSLSGWRAEYLTPRLPDPPLACSETPSVLNPGMLPLHLLWKDSPACTSSGVEGSAAAWRWLGIAVVDLDLLLGCKEREFDGGRRGLTPKRRGVAATGRLRGNHCWSCSERV
ncbi:hypothetical protein F7725_015032 [Dissostichus mawsoni]|uniref:Uncharacterized protein n=1 Tax=Dissostichus mawsoni TaxID=36200 RepID=A0A7J5YGH7_DISMA|nr:hypothetical protein F7725_015032 [Dissostichus mawsoni]